MPNRIIKESITTSLQIEPLSYQAEVLFYRLMVNCDDYGLMHGHPSIIRAKCYPLRIDKVKDKDIEQWLSELIKQNLLFLYTANGVCYLKLTNWDKHQQKRAMHSKYPQPHEGEVACNQLISDDSNSNQPQSNVPEKRETRNDIREARNEKRAYAESVTMTEVEHQKLTDEHGEDATKRMIEILNNYKGSSGKKYKSDYLAILNWVVKRHQEEKPKSKSPTRRTYDERDGSQYDDNALILKRLREAAEGK